jgi:hypothetical protein
VNSPTADSRFIVRLSGLLFVGLAVELHSDTVEWPFSPAAAREVSFLQTAPLSTEKPL